MAGDWIKMRVDLTTDPAVLQIAAMTGLDEDTVVGKLHRVWSWADAHTTDGHLKCGLTVVDRLARHDGFAAAMQAVGWLEVDDAGAVLPRFDIHNGKTAKARAQAAKRAGSKRKRDAQRDGSVTPALRRRDGSVTNCAPREEKRREETEIPKAESPSRDDAVVGDGEVAVMLADAGFKPQNALKLSAHVNATPERVRWLIGEAAARGNRIRDPCGFIAAGIRDGSVPQSADDFKPTTPRESASERAARLVAELAAEKNGKR